MRTIRITPVLPLFGALCLTIGIGRVPAAQLIWDPSQNGSGIASSGNWDTNAGNTIWYNGSSDVLWSQTSPTSPTQGATFNGPDAAPGTYSIVLDTVQVAVNSLIINSNGYSFSGTNAVYIGANSILSVGAGKTVTFNCPMAGSGTVPVWLLGSGSSMYVGGSLGSGQQIRLAGPANSAYYLGGSASGPAIVYVLAPVNLTNGTISTTASFFIGYQQTINSIAYPTGVLTVGTAGNPATLTVNGNNLLFVGRASGNGTLNLVNGTVNVGQTANHNLGICFDANPGESGTVNVNGGTVNVGSSTIPSQIAF
jgi:hypothetical protein